MLLLCNVWNNTFTKIKIQHHFQITLSMNLIVENKIFFKRKQ